MRSSSRRLLGVLAAACVLAAVPAVASASESIEGTWSYQGGRIQVVPNGIGTFRGTVTSPTRFLDCDHPLGERVWSISGSGSSYTGTHQWFEAGTCAPAPGGEATWNIRDTGDRFLLDFCTAPPGAGPPSADNTSRICSTLSRAKPPATSPERICLLNACLIGTGDADAIGCVRRGLFKHRFLVRLRGSARRTLRVKVVRFKLDGRGNGRDRRTPFVAIVDGETLTEGAHTLAADVTLRARRHGGSAKRLTLKYAFNACE